MHEVDSKMRSGAQGEVRRLNDLVVPSRAERRFTESAAENVFECSNESGRDQERRQTRLELARDTVWSESLLLQQRTIMAHKSNTGSGFTHSLSKFKDKFKEALSTGDEFSGGGEGDDSGSDSEPIAMAKHFDEAFWVSAID